MSKLIYSVEVANRRSDKFTLSKRLSMHIKYDRKSALDLECSDK